MIAVILAVLITQSGWQVVSPTQPDEYARYAKSEGNGLTSELSLSRRKCACDPKVAAKETADALLSMPGVSVKCQNVTVCNESGQHLIALGIASFADQARRNIDVFLFRRKGYLYTFVYSFQSPQPNLDVEKKLKEFCPAS